MKSTIDLPDALVKQIKLRAVRDGQKLKDAIADLLRKGLAAPKDTPAPTKPRIIKDKRTGFPVIQCKKAAPGEELSPEQIADILLKHEVDWHHAAFR